jgi:hypothetical protein
MVGWVDIFPSPPDAEKLMNEVLKLSDRVVVLARMGARLLDERYDTRLDVTRLYSNS